MRAQNSQGRHRSAVAIFAVGRVVKEEHVLEGDARLLPEGLKVLQLRTWVDLDAAGQQAVERLARAPRNLECAQELACPRTLVGAGGHRHTRVSPQRASGKLI